MIISEDTTNKEQIQDPIQIEKSREVKVVFDLNINKIFAALHTKAFEQATKVDSNYKIQNSAIEGDENKSTFYGAGKHLIAAIPLKGEADRKICLDVIKTYIQWFSGPEFANNIKDDNLYPLQAKDTEKTETKTEEKNESIKLNSFQQFLFEETDTEENTEEENTEENKKESDKKEITDINSQTAKGFYTTYQIKIQGQKERPLADALSQLAKNIAKKFGIVLADTLKGFGVASFDWRTGANGKTKSLAGAIDTIKDGVKALIAVFGKINASELKTNYDNNIKTKYPQTSASSEIYDTKTINQKCKKWLSSKEKNQLKDAEYALCTKVLKSDASYKFFNQQFIADTLTKSITGLYKKFKHKVQPDMVIHINNYDNDAQNKDRPVGAVADSNLIISNNKLINEENEDIDNKKIENKKSTIKGADNNTDKVGNIDIEKISNDLNDICKSSDLGKEGNVYKTLVIESEKFNDFYKKNGFEGGTDIDKDKFNYVMCIKLTGIKTDESGKPISNESQLFDYIFRKNKLNESANFELNDIQDKIFKNVMKKNGINTIDKAQQFIKIYDKGKSKKEQTESNIVKQIFSKIFEDVIFEEDPNKNDVEKQDSEKTEKITDKISNDLKTISENEIKNIQLPFEIINDETKYWSTKKLIKQLKDNGINDNNAFSTLEKYNGALVIKLSKISESQNNNDIEDRLDEPEQLGTGESIKSSNMNSLLKEAIPVEKIKKQLLDVGKKIFDKIVSNFKDDLIENDSNEILNVEYENNFESLKMTSFNNYILEASNYSKGQGKDIIKQKGYKNLKANIEKCKSFIKANYKTKKGEDKEKSIRYKTLELLDQFSKCESDESMIKFIEDNFKDGGKDSEDNRIRTAFIKSLDLSEIPNKEDEKSITITFKDIDDPSKIDDFTSLTSQDKEKYKQLGDPIEVKSGEDIDMPEVKEKNGYKFDKWDPDPTEMKESGDTYAIYQEKDEDKEKKDPKEESIKPFQYLILPKNISIKEKVMTKIFAQAFNTKNEDENNNQKKINRTDIDYYIVPMKGLKYTSGK